MASCRCRATCGCTLKPRSRLPKSASSSRVSSKACARPTSRALGPRERAREAPLLESILDLTLTHAEQLGRLARGAAHGRERLQDGEPLELGHGKTRRDHTQVAHARFCHPGQELCSSVRLLAPEHGAFDGVLEL